MKSKTDNALPIINYSKVNAGVQEEIEKLRHACSDWGVFYLEDTPISQASIAEMFQHSKQFFDLSLAKKKSLDFKNATNFSGYVRFGEELTRGQTDLKESFVIGQDTPPPKGHEVLPFYSFFGRSQFPDAFWLPDFKEGVTNYLQQQKALGQQFMRFLAQSLSISPSNPNSYCTRPLHLRTRLMNYERLNPGVENEIRVHEHTDLALFNMLLIDKPGLEAKDSEGNWHSVMPKPGKFIIILGEITALWSNNQFRAGIHRVRNSELKKQRISIAFFFFPNLMSTLKSVEESKTQDKQVGEVLWNRINSIY